MRSRAPALIGLAIAGAQAGHLLAYRLRFGPAAQQVQSSAAHAYFPAFVKTAFGVAALAVIGALLVIAAARIAARGHRVRAQPGPSFVGLLAVLFTLQLSWFMAQETLESMLAGAPAGSISSVVLWGMLGQLPVAVAGAAVLAWLGARFEAAAAGLGAVIPATLDLPVTAAIAVRAVGPGERAVATAHASHIRIVKRGPPSSSRFRTF